MCRSCFHLNLIHSLQRRYHRCFHCAAGFRHSEPNHHFWSRAPMDHLDRHKRALLVFPRISIPSSSYYYTALAGIARYLIWVYFALLSYSLLESSHHMFFKFRLAHLAFAAAHAVTALLWSAAKVPGIWWYYHLRCATTLPIQIWMLSAWWPRLGRCCWQKQRYFCAKRSVNRKIVTFFSLRMFTFLLASCGNIPMTRRYSVGCVGLKMLMIAAGASGCHTDTCTDTDTSRVPVTADGDLYVTCQNRFQFFHGRA